MCSIIGNYECNIRVVGGGGGVKPTGVDQPLESTEMASCELSGLHGIRSS